MSLTDIQKETVKSWVDEGCSLSEIQSRISTEFGLSMTYMDVRFLVLDLGVAVQDRAARHGENTDIASATVPAESDGADGVDELSAGVSVEVDRVMRAGSLVSGTVRFSDGVSASWALDQVGRLALDGPQPGYRPSEQDLQAFQDELRKALEGRGF